MSESKSISPKWGNPEAVLQVTELMQNVETRRALERAKINAFANGDRPWTNDEVKKYGIQLNVNWLEFTTKLIAAIAQINNAFIPNGNFFTAHSEGDAGQPAKKTEFGQKFTKNINQLLKRGPSGKRFRYVQRSRNPCVALHGIGPLMWTNRTRLFPRFVPLEDLLIPTDTLLDFSNLPYFAVNLYLTPGELFRLAMMGTDKGWSKEAVLDILKGMRNDDGKPTFGVANDTDWNSPEALEELWKQNSGYLDSDAPKKCRLRAFYWQDPKPNKEGIQCWYRKIVLRDNAPSEISTNKFIYDSTAVFADEINHILHCQFGDNSLIAPLKYHSVRGIGVMLYAPSFTLNRTRCAAMQHISQNLQTWYRITDPTDRDRAKAVLMMANGILPEGASIVPQQERHQIDARLLEFGMAQMKQNISENSTSFSSELDSGTNKEQTKFEVQAKLQAASAMIGSVLSMMYGEEIFLYEEMVRRALLPNTDDPHAIRFQKMCKEDDIPKELMVADNWRIIPERVLGAGDNALAQAQADALMSQIMMFEADKQREILRTWVSITTNDPDRAKELVSETDDKSTSGTRAAEEVYATLMRGIPVPMRKGIDHIGYCKALLGMMGAEIQKIMAAGEDAMGTPQDLQGFMAVAQSIGQNIQFLSQDDRNKQTVKQLGDQLGQLMNMVKAMAQRQQEAAQNEQPQVDVEAQAKAQATTMLAEVKAQISELQTQQKLEQKQAAFEQKMEQSWQKHMANMETQSQKVNADLTEQGMRASADLQAKGLQTGADVKAKEIRTDADVEASKKKAAAAPKAKDG